MKAQIKIYYEDGTVFGCNGEDVTHEIDSQEGETADRVRIFSTCNTRLSSIPAPKEEKEMNLFNNGKLKDILNFVGGSQ